VELGACDGGCTVVGPTIERKYFRASSSIGFDSGVMDEGLKVVQSIEERTASSAPFESGITDASGGESATEAHDNGACDARVDKDASALSDVP
jgi:hypothetical protein